jgi:hypothetical protein
LKRFVVIRVATEPVFYQAAFAIDLIYDQGISIIEMPYFIAFDPVKCRELVLLQ